MSCQALSPLLSHVGATGFEVDMFRFVPDAGFFVGSEECLRSSRGCGQRVRNARLDLNLMRLQKHTPTESFTHGSSKQRCKGAEQLQLII